jgi:PGF-pre-PGF domain-containing protein
VCLTIILGFVVLLFLVSPVHGNPDVLGTAWNFTIHGSQYSPSLVNGNAVDSLTAGNIAVPESLISSYPVIGGHGYFSTIDAGGVGSFSSVAVDSNGYTRISYADTTNGHLKYAWQNGSSWENYTRWYNTTIDSSGNVGNGTSLKLDDAGYSHISYLDSANHALKYAWQNASGWNIATVDSGGIGGFRTSLALDSSGFAHISYYDESNGNLRYCWQNESGWWNVTVDETGDASGYASLALDDSGNARISYYDSLNGDLRFASENSGTWTSSVIDSGGDVGNCSSLALDNSGFSHVSYSDTTNGHLKYAWQNSSGWYNATFFGANGTGAYSSLALDIDGNPHISFTGTPREPLWYAWQDERGWNIVPEIIPWIIYRDAPISTLSLAMDSEGWYHMSCAIGTVPVLFYEYMHVGPIPFPDFTTNVTAGTTNVPVQFNDTSIGKPIQWYWDFGDGNHSSEQNPVHTYSSSGHFLIRFSANNIDGSGTIHRNFDVFSIPVADFTANITSGRAPLTVRFSDISSNGPTGWNWTFGDENSPEPWTLINPGAGWSERFASASVVLPDGHIVMAGGQDNHSNYLNDTWLSVDNGITWTVRNSHAGWSGRSGHSIVAMPDGSIILMGGYDNYSCRNDTWISVDEGATWTIRNSSSGWSGRAEQSSVALPEGTIILTGGYDGYFRNDTWRSSDRGATWIQVNQSAGWTTRSGHTSIGLADGSVVLMGGYDFDNRLKMNDVWRSVDDGATWMRVNSNAGWSPRFRHSSVVMPDDSIILTGGKGESILNDTWKSSDDGATWTQVSASGPWPARYFHNSVAMTDGSVILFGGALVADGGGIYNAINDTWRAVPTGSSQQDPVHTYRVPGIYTVALHVDNGGGAANEQKIGYISVKKTPVLIPPEGNPDSGGSNDPPNTGLATGQMVATRPGAGPGQSMIFTFSQSGGQVIITRVEVIPNREIGSLELIAQPVPPGQLMKVPGLIVAGYEQISPVGLNPNAIDHGTITFGLAGTWLTSHQVTPADIILLRYHNNEWRTLPTRFDHQAGDTFYFVSDTPGFSYFAVAAKPVGSTTGNISVALNSGEVPVLPPATTIDPRVTLPIPEQKIPVTTRTSAVASSPLPSGNPGIPTQLIVFGFLGCIGIIAILVVARRWWIRRQNPALFREY